ncbi:uncharacterized protein LAESUDRAFT_672827 [Laetiporus sulphureus 93-53]|uniref:DUF1279 domain-containing protein n=1 Tax=Laetiporus sulphureus 93-53 TaxID=1314785 RepID=A0A165H0P0_9APHY|nr:uncharacterized protein LAESUDRAFT_672827 [Laetiporus sulphureus 93-53]KZT11089.1 hypothetical protein LAESUDRAFT_672827 [Laetiporus sulphureus 93-53]
MVRSLIPRFPIFRAFLPRIAQPILPLTRFAAAPPLAGARTPSTTRLFHHIPARLASSRPSSPSPDDPSSPDPPPNASISQRLKHLIKTYGWYALGVYIFLSVADFTVAFAGINLIGAEHVSRVTVAVKDYLTRLVHSRPPEPGREEMESMSSHASAGGQESLYAMLVLAYTVHKTLFLPVRVGLTAALTPRLVRWLQVRGWAGGAGTKRAAREMRDRMRSGREKD